MGRPHALESLMHKMHNLHNDLGAMHCRDSLEANDLSPPCGPKSSSNRIARICTAAILFFVAGCGQHDEIARYSVTKPELVDPKPESKATTVTASGTQQQTVGLIVPVGEMSWFFKLTGAKEAVAEQH